MTTKRLDAAAILAKLSELRKGLPKPTYPVTPTEPAVVFPPSDDPVADFEEQAVADALQSLSAELNAVIEEAQAKAVRLALETYYAAEELSRDPAHAELIPHVEAMRKAYERDFGKPIPPRKK